MELSVEGDHLHVQILGWDKFLGMRSTINVPLTAIKSVREAPGFPEFQWTDVRVLGTGIPRKIAIGTYWIGSPHRWAFLDVRSSSKDIVALEIEGEFYSRIIVEVKNAPAAIQQIRGSAVLAG
ncbi:hypothetical protein [Candidatus Binatus sp.]|uniref:hypothetical protein n=1 Tax=Candidatus Binatus sp. TaxID=2811406 RepID=UPI003C704C7F